MPDPAPPPRQAPWKFPAALAVAVALVLFVRATWHRHHPSHPIPATAPAAWESVPPGIVVAESSSPSPPPAAAGHPGALPGDALLAGFADPSGSDHDDLVLLSRALANFLLIEKSATARPLSANGEWSAALLGRRGGSPWLTLRPPLFHPDGHLLDRHGHPLHFHALGHGKWEIRSSGPDGIPFSPDDTTLPLPPP